MGGWESQAGIVFQSSQWGSWGVSPMPLSSASNPPAPPHGMCLTVRPPPRFPDYCFSPPTHGGGRLSLKPSPHASFHYPPIPILLSQDTWLSLLPLAHIIKQTQKAECVAWLVAKLSAGAGGHFCSKEVCLGSPTGPCVLGSPEGCLLRKSQLWLL